MYTVILDCIKLWIILWAPIKYVSVRYLIHFDKIWSHPISSKIMVLGCKDFFMLTSRIHILIHWNQIFKLPKRKYRNLSEKHDACHFHDVKRIQTDDIFIHLNMRSRFLQAHNNILLYLIKNLLYFLIIHNIRHVFVTFICVFYFNWQS